MVNGILYFTSPNHVWAADARTGRELWHYQYPPNTGSTIGNRGVGMYGNWLFFESPDSNLVSLDAATGKERWKVRLADPEARLHLHGRSGDHRQSRDRGNRRGPSGQSRLRRVARSGDGQAAMEVVDHAAQGRAGHRDLARRVRLGARHRAGVDSGHVRSRAEPVHRRAPAIRTR